jgi:hypothetical protein
MDSRECPEVTEKFFVSGNMTFLLYRVLTHCCIKKLVGWESIMQETLTEREGLSALEQVRTSIDVHSNK